MKITDLQIDGFGVWKGLTAEHLSDDLTLFCGYNEAGKTTMMQFVRAMMFGFSEERIEKYTPPVYGGLAGGSLEVNTSEGKFEVQRYVDPNRHSDPIGDLTVTDHVDGTVHGRARLGSLMSDIDESIFVNVFAIGLQEIQELNALNSTAAAEQLYRLTSGLDRVSLVDVMKDQAQRRNNIWAYDPESTSRLAELSDQRQKLLREIDELKQRSKRWSHVAAETTDINNQLVDLEKELAAKNRESRLLEVAIQIADRWNSRKVINEQILALGKLPDRRDVSIEKLDTLNEKIAQQKERIEQVKIQRKTIKTEAMALPINRTLWAQKSRIEAVTEHMPWVESLQRQADRLEEEIDRIENNVVGEIDGLGHQLKLKAADIRELGNRGFSTLEQSGKKLQTETDRLTKFQNDLEKVEFDLGQHRDRLGTSLAEQGASESLEDTGRYVNRLRRRIELEEKIEKLNRQRQGLERDIDSIVNDQVLPVEKLSILGAAFVLGVLLFGIGVISSNWDTPFFSDFGQGATGMGMVFMLLGLIVGAISMAVKFYWESLAREDLEDFRHQMDIVRQQVRRTKNERDEIERQLPASIHNQWEVELQDAESRLMRLEELVPLENRVQSTQGVQDDVRRRITNQEREVKKAEEQWQASLRTAGLPETLRPHQLEEIIQRADRVSTFYVQLDQFKSEKIERDKELTALNQRIDMMLHETGVRFDSDNLVGRLNQLHRAINEQRQFVNVRKEHANKYKSLRSRLNKAKRELEKQLGLKQRLLAVVGVADEQEYRSLDATFVRRRKLMKKRDNVSEQITAALGKKFQEDQLTELLESYGTGGLEKQWEFIQTEVERLKERQAKLLTQRGEFIQEVKTLGEDSRLDTAQLELNCVNTQITQLQKDWQVLAASTQMLELIRESYESKRQPETLKEASNYLERLTEGKYTRIWTKLIGEELLVDNSDDDTLPVDKLSRGTREAVYLSLRLALVGAYARRGATIPMILDDVLVNFDGQRAYAAADVLHDFARNGHQILMFTCHDHMRDMFDSLGADVRVLPHHSDVVEHGAKPETFRKGPQPAPVSYEPPVNYKAPVSYEPAGEPIAFESRSREPVAMADPRTIPVEYVQYASSSVRIDPDDFDADLEYELSAVTTDQRSDQLLRSELVYISPNLPAPLDLSGEHDIWRENQTRAF